MNSNIQTIKLGTPSSIDGGASPNASISVQDMSQCESIALRDENGVKCTKVGAMAASLALISQTVSDKEINGSHVTLPLIKIEGQDANISDEQWYDTFAAIEALRDYTAQDGSSISGSITVPYCPPSAVEVLAAKYPQLTINVDAEYEEQFEDKEVIRILRNILAADKKHIKTSEVNSSQMKRAASDVFKGTNIKYFNEFERFTNCTQLEIQFTDCTELKSIHLPDTITRTYGVNNVFKGCTSLTDVVAKGLTECYGTSGSLFENCTSLKEISLPNFSGLSSLSLFRGCTSLESVNLPNLTILYWSSFEGCKNLKNLYLPKLERFDSSNIFSNSGLEEADFPKVTSLNEQFRGLKNLKKVNLPLVTSLGANTFNGCSSLVDITLPEATSATSYTFYGCTSLESVNIPKMTVACANMFSQCRKLVTVNMPALETVESCAFQNCELLKFDTYNIKKYGYGAFNGCISLTEVDINPDAVIGSAVFSNAKIVHLHEGMRSIPESFYGSYTGGYKYIVIPNSVETIGSYNFDYYHTDLIAAVIGTGIKNIGTGSFARLCRKNRQYKYYVKATTPPTVASDAFASNRGGTDWFPSRQSFYVPQSSLSAYKSADVWKDHADQIFGYDFNADQDGVNTLPLGFYQEL